MSSKGMTMSKSKQILIIGTYDIDIFYKLVDEMEKNLCVVEKATTNDNGLALLEKQAFDAILINLEPDGNGGIHGSDLLQAIASSPLQENAVCLGVSVQSPTSLLVSSPAKLQELSLLAGWLTLPILPDKATRTILSITESPGRLSVKHRLSHA